MRSQRGNFAIEAVARSLLTTAAWFTGRVGEEGPGAEFEQQSELLLSRDFSIESVTSISDCHCCLGYEQSREAQQVVLASRSSLDSICRKSLLCNAGLDVSYAL